MKKLEIVKINASDYGLEESQSVEMQQGLAVSISERKLLIKEFESVSTLEVTAENQAKFKELRLKFVKNRTGGADAWHKKGKEVSLRLGQFYDATKRQQNQINQSYEVKLMEAEKHLENLEKEKITKLQEARETELLKYMDDVEFLSLGTMNEDVYNSFLASKKQEKEDQITAEKEAEVERLKQEKAKKINADRMLTVAKYEKHIEKLDLGKIDIKTEIPTALLVNEEIVEKSVSEISLNELDLSIFNDEDFQVVLSQLEDFEEGENKKAEEQRVENERLQKEAEEAEKKRQEEVAAQEAEAERLQKIADDKLEKERKEKEAIAAELKAKEDEEKKTEEARLASIEAELNKGDAAKIKDLISDLEALKSKYEFKSKANKSTYSSVGGLIDKVVNYINEKS